MVRYGAYIINWNKEDLDKIDQQTQICQELRKVEGC